MLIENPDADQDPPQSHPLHLDAVQFTLGVTVPGLSALGIGYSEEDYVGPHAAVFERPKLYYRPNTDTVWLGKKFGARFTVMSTNGARLFRAMYPDEIVAATEALAASGAAIVGAADGEANLPANKLSPAERLALANLCGNQNPYVFLTPVLANLVGDVFDAFQETVVERYRLRAGKLPSNVRIEVPVLRRMELYLETPVGADLATRTAVARDAITRVAGGWTCRNHRGKKARRNHVPYEWQLDRRLGEGDNRASRSSVRLKMYAKGIDDIRIEVADENPMTRTDAEEMGLLGQMITVGRRNAPLLLRVDDHLGAERMALRSSELFAALGACGVRSPKTNTRYIEMVKQLVSTGGIYDPRVATDRANRLDHNTLRRHVARPLVGILRRVPRSASNGTSQENFYELQPDWRERARLMRQARAMNRKRAPTPGSPKVDDLHLEDPSP